MICVTSFYMYFYRSLDSIRNNITVYILKMNQSKWYCKIWTTNITQYVFVLLYRCAYVKGRWPLN